MNTLDRRNALITLAICICFLSAPLIALGAEPVTIAMTAEHWDTKENR